MNAGHIGDGQRGHCRLDERTRDTDLDNVVHFNPTQAEFEPSANRGFVKGKFRGPGRPAVDLPRMRFAADHQMNAPASGAGRQCGRPRRRCSFRFVELHADAPHVSSGWIGRGIRTD